MTEPPSEGALRQAIAAEERRLDLRLALARMLVSEGRLGEAAGILSPKKAFSGASGALHVDAGKILLEIGDYASACRHLGRALLLAPGAKLLRLQDLALSNLVREANQGVSPLLKTKYLKGLERLRRGEPAVAAGLFEQVAMQAPSFAPAWVAWRGALEASGDPKAAAKLSLVWPKVGKAAAGVASSALQRRLGRRGLIFDPREPVPWRKIDEVLHPARSAADLKATPDSVWILAEAGRRRRAAAVLMSDGTPDPSADLPYRTREVFVASISKAALVGRGAVLNRDGELLYDLIPRQDPAKYGGAWDGRTMRFDPRLFRDGALTPVFHERPAFLMAGPTDTSFGDWMLNFLPRLSLYRAAELDCDVVIRSDPVAHAREWLAAFGVPLSRVVHHDVTGISVFPTLYAPSWPLPAGRPMDGLFDLYRSADPPPGAPVGQKLYLGRQGLRRRPLLNEAEIEALFVRRGFQVVRPETLSIEEMRRIFAYPACVAGPYGSAVLNLVFCKSRPRCLFLVPPERPTFLKQLVLWMSCMGLSFRQVVGEPLGHGSQEKIDPWRVETRDIARVLDLMLSGIQDD